MIELKYKNFEGYFRIDTGQSVGEFIKEYEACSVIYPSGLKVYYRYGSHHKVDGPALEHSNGDKFWYLQGKRHREDGPAVEYANGDKFWYLNDKKTLCRDNDQFLKLMKLKAFW